MCLHHLRVLFVLFLAVGYVWPCIALQKGRSTRYKAGLVLKGSYEDVADVNAVLPEYDGAEIDRFYSKRPLEVWERIVDIGSPVLGWWLAKSFDTATSFLRSEAEREVLLNARAEDLRDAIVQGKSITLIKSGQALSLRPDLVKSPEYVRELAKLQDEVGTFPTKVALDIIEREIGCDDVHQVYEFVQPDPIASASIGQVFKARVKETGQLVAVKVQRPDAVQTTPLDMFIIRNVAKFLKKRYKLRSDLVKIADEFGSQIYKELNYEEEAGNCLKFKGLYGHIPGIFVPGVDLNLTRRRVLTMEWVEGEKGPWEEGGERLLTVGLQCSVLQLLGTGYFHSDPHRGNLLKTPGGDLAYLDFGMMSDVPAERRFALIGTVLGLVNKDIPLVINNLKTLNFLPDDTDTDIVVAALGNAVMKSTTGGKGAGSTLNFTALNKNINEMSYLLPISLPPFYTLIIRTLTILEGLALSVDPSFRLVKGAYPFIAKQILLNQAGNGSDVGSQREMNKLLSSIMIDRETQRIRWDKLEQFVSISSYADRALEGDFTALKSAQSRADLIKTYSKQDKSVDSPGETTRRLLQGQGKEQLDEDAVPLTQELVMTVLDFLLSPNGRFIREPLITEAVETVDALGLTAASLGSLLTNGLLPKPHEVPDQDRVVQVLNLVSALVTNSTRVGAASNSSSASIPSQILSGNVEILADLSSTLRKWVIAPDPETQERVQEILTKATPLARQVMGKLVSRNVQRATKELISPGNVEATLPSLLQVFELASRVVPGKQKEKEKEKEMLSEL